MSECSTTDAGKDCLIYLVDDEALLLDMAEFALQPEGYELRRFQNPEAALDAFRQETTKPALLLTDFAMDSMNGMELSEKCKASHPDLKILMVSGTAGSEIVLQSPGTVDHFIPKPYSPAELANTVRSLLGGTTV
jgi:two-component system, cell cycle sensor histidine kinase and response regulator CckA